MPTTFSDTLYKQFLKEAREDEQNFYFVKQFDEDLYKQLAEADSNAMLNLRSAGNALRQALEKFMKAAMPGEYQDEVFREYARRKGSARSRSADIVDYETVYARHRDCNVNPVYFKTVREVGNEFSHDPSEKRSNRKDTYQNLCDGLNAMHAMLHSFFTKEDPGKMRRFANFKYEVEKQAIGDKLVCSAVSTCDSTACERQILCSQRGRVSGNPKYFLLRVYRAGDTSAGALRDEKVLSNLWESSLRGMPNIVRYSSLHVTYEGAWPAREKKHIVSYDFGAFKPMPLHPELLKSLSPDQKLMVLHDIAAGVKVLHDAGIYHRNLQPNSVFVFQDKKSGFVQAKLIGFEYAKMDGDGATVLANVAKNLEHNPLAFFSLTMQQGLKNKQVAVRLDWAKEDIYSMGALFWFVLTGNYPGLRFDKATLTGKADPALIDLIGSMMNLNIVARPDAGKVLEALEPKYRTLI